MSVVARRLCMYYKFTHRRVLRMSTSTPTTISFLLCSSVIKPPLGLWTRSAEITSAIRFVDPLLLLSPTQQVPWLRPSLAATFTAPLSAAR